MLLPSLLLLALTAYTQSAQAALIDYDEHPLRTFAAEFNGIATITVVSPSQPSCDGHQKTIPNYRMAIGPQNAREFQGKPYSRSSHDTNPFWFDLAGPQNLHLVSTKGSKNNSYADSGFANWEFWHITTRPPATASTLKPVEQPYQLGRGREPLRHLGHVRLQGHCYQCPNTGLVDGGASVAAEVEHLVWAGDHDGGGRAFCVRQCVEF
jgi:hypothetical protein